MTIFPSQASAGLTFDRTAVLTAFQAPAWQLSAFLRGPGVINLQSVAMGANHQFHALAADTSQWVPGVYWYSIRATNGVDVVEVESGEITIKADLAGAVAGHDGRVHVERVIAAIEAVLEKRATLDQERYRINNRELFRTPVPALLELRDRYRAELRRMKAVARGGLFDKAVRVRFRGAS